jgi:hypothetical protein
MKQTWEVRPIVFLCMSCSFPKLSEKYLTDFHQLAIDLTLLEAIQPL